jgi:cyclopropane fatty-acyl-phospholipid synthase-like methyltransferase
MMELLEYRHDWAAFHMTPELFKYVVTRLIPEVILHTTSQDEEQVRGHYDRGDDFYSWFLGPRMIYTSGIISDPDREETLEELQDNKLKLVCQKLDLQPEDNLLDIGCGWGTLAAFAAKNYGCKATGVTLGKNQTKFGNDRLAANGIPSSQAKIVCQDAREIPAEPKGRYTKISCLEMAEHVGIRRYPDFLKQVYDLLADDGTMVFQVAGIRPNWQYEDLIWGLFMNKYIFPGADASLSLGWVITKLEQAGFEVKSVDVLGVHYSATLYRWYKNWKTNEAKVKAKYGDKWYRIWEFFLAYSVSFGKDFFAAFDFDLLVFVSSKKKWCSCLFFKPNLTSYETPPGHYFSTRKCLIIPDYRPQELEHIPPSRRSQDAHFVGHAQRTINRSTTFFRRSHLSTSPRKLKDC